MMTISLKPTSKFKRSLRRKKKIKKLKQTYQKAKGHNKSQNSKGQSLGYTIKKVKRIFLRKNLSYIA